MGIEHAHLSGKKSRHQQRHPAHQALHRRAEKGCFEKTDPVAQASAPSASTVAPIGFTRPPPPKCEGPTKKISPENPSARPANTRPLGRAPPGRSHSTITIQSETVATRIAATPDGTVCSDQQTAPL